MPRLAKVVNVLAIRQVKQGTETTGFRIGFTRTRVNMLALDLICITTICLKIGVPENPLPDTFLA